MCGPTTPHSEVIINSLLPGWSVLTDWMKSRLHCVILKKTGKLNMLYQIFVCILHASTIQSYESKKNSEVNKLSEI